MKETLKKMPGLSKPLFKFMGVLLTTVLCLRGRMNFRRRLFSGISGRTSTSSFVSKFP